MKIVFFGTDSYAESHLKALIERGREIVLVVSQPDRPKGRGRKVEMTPVKELALSFGIDVVQPLRLKSDDFIEILRSKNPDVGIVVSYGRLIPKKVIEIPKSGIFCVHPSLLPKYRGAAPIRRALENGEKITGITIFKLVEEMDAGPIALMRELEVGEFETFGQLESRLIELGKEALNHFLDLLESGKIELRPQDDASATYAPKITREDLVLDFTRSCVEVKDKIRAYDPKPGVIASLKNEVVKLFGVKALRYDVSDPGKVMSIDREGAWIGCGDGSVLVEKIQFPGKRVMTFWDAKNGRKISEGDVLRKVEP